MSATNLSAPESYVEDTPLNLTDIVISASATATATLTLSDAAAGALSTATSGAVTSTYDSATGVWSASGAIADVNALLAAVTFTPAENFNDSFSIATSVSDDTGTATGSKLITGTAVNDAPIAVDDSYTTNEDTALGVAAPGILANDTDVDGNVLTVSLVSGPANGTVTLNLATGAFTYTPAANFNGTDSFTYQANDGTANSNVATVTLTVNPVNDAPVAVDDSYIINEDVTLTATFLGNDTDVDGDPLIAAVVTAPAHGTVTLDPFTFPGSFSYTPDSNFNGTDSFTYLASDGTANANVATVTLTVTPVNDAPIAVDDSYTTIENTALSVPAPGILGNDSDVEGTALTHSW